MKTEGNKDMKAVIVKASAAGALKSPNIHEKDEMLTAYVID